MRTSARGEYSERILYTIPIMIILMSKIVVSRIIYHEFKKSNFYTYFVYTVGLSFVIVLLDNRLGESVNPIIIYSLVQLSEVFLVTGYNAFQNSLKLNNTVLGIYRNTLLITSSILASVFVYLLYTTEYLKYFNIYFALILGLATIIIYYNKKNVFVVYTEDFTHSNQINNISILNILSKVTLTITTILPIILFNSYLYSQYTYYIIPLIVLVSIIIDKKSSMGSSKDIIVDLYGINQFILIILIYLLYIL